MTTELKPCPFCGRESEPDHPDTIYPSGRWREDDGLRHYLLPNDKRPEHGRTWGVNCYRANGGCGCRVTGDSRDEAVAAWNRRAVPCAAVAPAPHSPKSTEGHTLAYDPQDWGVATVKDSLSVAAAAVCKHWHGNACADHVKLDELIGKLDTALKSIQSTYPADVSKDGDEIDTTEDRADAARYRAFFDAGLPITYLGQEYRDKASLDAAIDAMKAATP